MQPQTVGGREYLVEDVNLLTDYMSVHKSTAADATGDNT